MSKVCVCTVKDTKAEAYFTPIFVRSTGEAIRSFSDEANNKDQSMIGKHPEDYVLFYLGKYDETEGTFELEAAPKALARAIDLVRSPTVANT